MLVVIAILGLIAGVATVSVVSAPRTPAADPLSAAIGAARAKALSAGRAVTATVPESSGTPITITALPDGSVIAHSSLRWDRLTGERLDAR